MKKLNLILLMVCVFAISTNAQSETAKKVDEALDRVEADIDDAFDESPKQDTLVPRGGGEEVYYEKETMSLDERLDRLEDRMERLADELEEEFEDDAERLGDRLERIGDKIEVKVERWEEEKWPVLEKKIEHALDDIEALIFDDGRPKDKSESPSEPEQPEAPEMPTKKKDGEN